MLRIFFLYILITIIINLSFDQTMTHQPALTFTTADQHRQVELALLDTFQIQLPVQMGSGYQWIFSDMDHPGFRLLSHSLKDIKPLPGGKQYQIFTFEATQDGFKTLKLSFRKSWEDEVEDEYKMYFNISAPYAQKLPQ